MIYTIRYAYNVDASGHLQLIIGPHAFYAGECLTGCAALKHFAGFQEKCTNCYFKHINVPDMKTASNAITIETTIQAPISKVWDCWTRPEHIMQWSNASDEWHTPHAENDLRLGGSFRSRMEAKDGSAGFDFGGVYDTVVEHKEIAYTMQDGRKVRINFDGEEETTRVTETFDAESESPAEMQRHGWQSILDNFRKYVESKA